MQSHNETMVPHGAEKGWKHASIWSLQGSCRAMAREGWKGHERAMPMQPCSVMCACWVRDRACCTCQRHVTAPNASPIELHPLLLPLLPLYLRVSVTHVSFLNQQRTAAGAM